MSEPERATRLLLISDREALAWVLAEQRMAFRANRAADARALRAGDRLFLYTTRGCFRNPTRDRGRIIGEALVAAKAAELDERIEVAGRTFTIGCRLRIKELAPLHQGVELAPLVSELETFPNPGAWSAKMRQTLVRVADADVPRLSRLLAPMLRPRNAVLDDYVHAARRTPTALRADPGRGVD